MNAPNIKWAERKDKLFITIDLDDVKDAKIDITESNHLTFSCSSAGKVYSLDLELYGEVDKSNSKWTLDTRNIFLKIQKKTKGPYWNYINKDKKKHPFIHVDWALYIDEDEEDEKPEFNYPGGNFMDMGGMGGMGGMGDYPEPDEDDGEERKNEENLEDLDKAEEKTN